MTERPSEPLSRESAGEPAPANNAEPAALTKAAPEDVERGEEIGGPAGPDPTRFGDWERKGRCIDF